MPRALILNPNTTEAVTRLLHQHAMRMLGDEWELRPATARFGARYIVSETAYAIAGHAVLDAWATCGQGCDAVLVGCFGDPGLEALRELSGAHVVGLAEAAMQEAAAHGRFAIVSGGERWRAILQRRAVAAGVADRLCGIRLLSESGAELLADPARAIGLLGQAVEEAVRDWGADAVVIGGAALGGMGEALAAHAICPVIDNVSAAMRALQKLPPPRVPDLDHGRLLALSPELGALLGG